MYQLLDPYCRLPISLVFDTFSLISVELNRARRGSGEDLVDLSELPGERFLRLLQVNRR